MLRILHLTTRSAGASPPGEAKEIRAQGDVMNKTHNPSLTAISKHLRRNMTPEERHLWYDFLKKLPLTIHRQKVIGRYIADFYCAEGKIVIEVDGSQHYTDEGKEYDENRTYVINQFNVRVIRFSNHDINTNFQSVCMEIDKVVSEILNIERYFE